MCLTGLSPELKTVEQIRQIMRPTDVPDAGDICGLRVCDLEPLKCGEMPCVGSAHTIVVCRLSSEALQYSGLRLGISHWLDDLHNA